MDKEAWVLQPMGSQTIGHDWVMKLNLVFLITEDNFELQLNLLENYETM